MLFSLYTIRDNIAKINTLNGQIKNESKVDNLVTYKNKFYAFAYDLSLAVGEAYFTTGMDIFDSKYNNILMQIRDAQLSETVSDFKSCLNNICEEFRDFDYKYYNSNDFNSTARAWNRAYYNFNQEELVSRYELSVLCNKITAPVDRDLTLFYPDCYDAVNILPFKSMKNNVLAYGNAAKEGALSRAKLIMHKAVKGVLRGSRIQNNAFDMMYIQPRILFEIDEDNVFGSRRIEKNYISDMFKYLKNDGVMVITMPYTRLYKDVCSTLSKYLKNIEVIKAAAEEFTGLGLVHIIGQKDVAKLPRDEEYAKLRRLYEHSRIKHCSELDDNVSYTLPRSSVYIDLFKGSALDLEEMEQIINKSSLMDKMWKSQKVEKLDENIKNPLLPFNIGQLGLVLTSGCLDGIVDEQDGYSHLIKGRVSKQIVESEVEENGKIKVTETTVNKVEINVLLPNGEFKVLA